jgi:hypothetical protein
LYRLAIPPLAFAGFMGLGALLTAKALRNAVLAVRSKEWPTTGGKVTHTHILTSGGPASSLPTIRYSYVVSGRAYAGERVFFGDTQRWMSRARAVEYLRNYEVGSKVSVHYNPERPSQSTLRTGLTPSLRNTIIASCLYLGVMLLLKLW